MVSASSPILALLWIIHEAAMPVLSSANLGNMGCFLLSRLLYSAS